MSLTTTASKRLTRAQSQQLPALLEFHSPSAALLEVRERPIARSLIWMVLAMFGSAATAAALIQIDVVVTGTAKVVMTDATIMVQPLETAILREMPVKEGQLVHKGDLLAKLDPTFAGADAVQSVAQTASLAAEVDRLTAESKDADYRPATTTPETMVQRAIYGQRHTERVWHIENYKQKIESLQATLNKAISDVKAYSDRLQIAATVEDKRQELQRLGWGSQLNALAATDAKLDLLRNLHESQQTALGAANDLAAMKAEFGSYDHQWRAQVAMDLTDSTRKLIDATNGQTKNDLRSKLVELRAPVDSYVLTRSRVSMGSIMQSGDQLLTMIPADAHFEISAAIAGDDAGYVHPGNDATLKFDTLPFVHYGTASGVVLAVSPDSFTQNTSASDPTVHSGAAITDAPQPMQQTFYSARISLDKLDLHDVPPGFRIKPGMPVTADIMVGKRTIMEYIFQKYMTATFEGMREP